MVCFFQYLLTEYLCIKIIVFYITGSFASFLNSQTTNSLMHKAPTRIFVILFCQLFISIHVYAQATHFMQEEKVSQSSFLIPSILLAFTLSFYISYFLLIFLNELSIAKRTFVYFAVIYSKFSDKMGHQQLS